MPISAPARPGALTTDAPSFLHVLRARSEEQPDARAFTFLGDDANDLELSYGELDRRARAVAAALQAEADPGDRILLLFPPGVEYVVAMFGCFYAGVVPVPAYPPDPARLERTLPRLQAIVDDARARALLTIAPIVAVSDQLLRGDLSSIATDELPDGIEDSWSEPVATRETLALLQYTSGSTSSPRGVMVSHGNLLANSEFIHRGYGHSRASSGVIWLPPYHDMGLIGGVLQPVFGGFPCALMSPLSFLRRPLRWLEAVTRFGATTSGGPNFAYDLCVRRVTAEQRETLDLSSWEVAFNGAEPVRLETIDRFSEAFAPCGFRREAFYPCYGLAEGTLMVTGPERLREPRHVAVDAETLEREQRAVPAGGSETERVVVACGMPDTGHEVTIADPATLEPRAAGEVGEIMFRGPSAAGGYWGRPDESEATFEVTLADGSGPYVRTGDLGFERDGELHPTGRIKDLVIVGGRNHYPEDVERACEQTVAALRPNCGAVFTVEREARERVAVVYEVADDPALDHESIIAGIRRAGAAALGVQVDTVNLIRPRTLPKTSSGKVQRWVCRSMLIGGELDTVAAWSLAAA